MRTDRAQASPADTVFRPVKSKFGWNVGSRRNCERRWRAGAGSIWRAWLSDQIRAADVGYADNNRTDKPEAPPSVEALADVSTRSREIT